ncbi:MAG: Hpt domain-containing protein [Pseudomonadota bacterium]
MSQDQEHFALDWIKGDLFETLDSARASLEAFSESENDLTLMRACVTALHQVHGTLIMLELPGIALLADHMEQVAQAVFAEEVSASADAVAQLMQGVLELPSYLEAIAAGQGDSARPVIPLTNELREHLGQEPLELPAVNVLASHASDAAVARFDGIAGDDKVRKIRSAYQQVLLSILKGQDRAEAVATLRKVAQGLTRICDDTPHEGQWQAFGEFVESLSLQSGPLDAEAIKLLRRIDAELRTLATEGASALQQPVNRDLIEALLRQAEDRDHNSERLADLKAAVAEGAPVDSLVISGRQALASAALALREDVSELRDTIDLDVRSEKTDRDSFAALIPPLSQIGNTLSLLGFSSSQATIFDQVEAINDALLQQSFELATLETVAHALIAVDETLAGATQGMGGQGEVERITSEAQRAVAREAREALETVKGAIVAYVSSGWDYSTLEGTPAVIDEACGALDMIPLPRPARQLAQCRQFIAGVLSRAHPDWETLDQLADAISGVDYYLERTIEENGASAESVLDLVDRSLAALPDADAPAADSAEPVADSPLVVRATPTQAVLMSGRAAEESAATDPVEEPALDRSEDSAAESTEESAEASAEEPAPDAIEEATADAAEMPEPLIEPEAVDDDALAEAAQIVPDEHAMSAPADLEVTDDLIDVEAAFAAQSAEAGVDDGFDLDSDEFDLGDASEYEEEAASTGPAHDLAVSAIAAAAAGGVAAGLADDHQEDEEIAEIFLEEAGEVLDQIDHWLPEWAAAPDNEEALTELRRAFHTLKGSGRMVGANVSGELAWAAENMLNRVLDQTVTPGPQFVELCQQIRAQVPVLLKDFEHQRAPDLGPVGVLIEAADVLASGGALSALPDLDEAVATPAAAAEVEPDSRSDVVLDSAPETETDPQQIFIDEAREHLAVLTAALAGGTFQANDAVLRALHTLAGSASMAEAQDLAQVARPAYELARALGSDASRAAALGDETAAFMARYADATDSYVAALEASTPATMPDALKDDAEALLDQCSGDDTSHQLLSIDGLGALFDADDYLQRWRAGAPDADFSVSLSDTLERLGAQARALELGPLAQMADALRSTHEHLAGGPLDDETAAVLGEAHEQLLSHIDALVADETPPVLDAVRDALEALAAGEADDAATAEPVGEPTAQTREADYDLAGLDIAEEELDAEDAISAPTAPSQPAATPTVAPAAEPTPVAAGSAADAEYDAEIIEIFVEEAEELLEGLDETIHALEQERDNHLYIENLLRDLHTMKGGARLATMTALGDLTHEFESEVLEQQARGDAADDAFVALLHTRHDALLTMVGSVKTHLEQGCVGMATCAAVVGLDAAGEASSEISPATLPQEDATPATTAASEVASSAQEAADEASGEVSEVEAVSAVAAAELEQAADAVADADEELLVASAANESMTDLSTLELEAERDNVVPLMQAAGAGQKIKPPVAQAQAAPRVPAESGGQEMVRVGAGLLEELVNLAGESSIMRGRIEQGLGDFTVALDEMETTIGRVREQLRRLEIETEAQILFRQERFDAPAHEDFDPLEMDRYSQLQQLSRSLSESASDMLDLKETLLFKARESETLLLQQARINTELQEGLMRTRMVPFSRLLPRLRRTVRQVASELGKDVEFSAYNAEGELDRNLLDRMIPPLEHMLRNAVDHGIETPSERRSYNKRSAGQIELRLGREGGDVLIEISDDGAGIDVESVRAKAIERGLMQADAQLSDEEILQFVLAPGFSTAKSVTQISGRGVGMDVVHSEVKQLGGSISIASKPGEGARFSLRVPFTVSVNRALMVSVGDDLYAIPLNTIEGIVLLGAQELDRLYAPDANAFEYAGVDYQVRYLGHFLGREYRGNASGSSAPVVLVRSGDQAIAVHVDSVQGSREIVVKSLGPQFAGVGGVSGATILGDGSVVVILDLLALIRSRSDQPRMPARRPVAQGSKTRCVMVVDDSVTVRKVTSRLLERQGMDVLTAKDGVEAVALLQERRPDILLLDIEMPRMDGFEVARQVRHDDQLEGLPIIMISSRTGEKHQERATGLGVNRFLGKPFQESELLETIDQLVES